MKRIYFFDKVKLLTISKQKSFRIVIFLQTILSDDVKTCSIHTRLDTLMFHIIFHASIIFTLFT